MQGVHDSPDPIEMQSEDEQTDDELHVSYEGDHSFYKHESSLLKQAGYLFILMLKLKAWRFLLGLVTVALLLSNLYLSLLLKQENAKIEDGLKFYGASDFASLGHRVLIDRSADPTEAQSAVDIMTDRGVPADWLRHCTPESDCRAKFINELDPSVIGYIKYKVKEANTTRAVLECFWVDGSDLRCAHLYQLMAQSMLKASLTDGVFMSVQFFTLNYMGNASAMPVRNYTEKKAVSLPNSICADWINRGTFAGSLGIIMIISLALITIGVAFYFAMTTVACIRILKTDGFLQQLFRNGLSVTSYWGIIWTITILECLLFSGIFILSHTLHCPGVYPFGKMMHVFLMFHSYCLSLAALAFLLELLIPSNLAFVMMMTLVCIGLIISFALYFLMQNNLSFIPFIFPPMHAKDYIVAYMVSGIELLQTGVDPVVERSSHYLSVLLSIMATVIVLGLVTIYLDFLLRAGNGLCLPFYYPFHCGFWCPGAEDDELDGDIHAEDGSEISNPNIEPGVGLSPSVNAYGIRVAYKNCCPPCTAGPEVLRGLSCKMYRNQITALVGHNGAGKTTLMKILTGDESPDDGEAYINNIIVTDPLKRLALRGNISVCPQFDCLCGALTVMQCIKATLVSRGASQEYEKEKVLAMLQLLGLEGKEDVKSKDLSGGQKRKVCTIMALLGDPDVVFLDEPTSGLDPVSRRQLWQMLQLEKLDRTIIMCTQFMDEADILADRKIFLSGGEIVCAGSSLFLKRAFGCGFTLDVSLKSEDNAPDLMAKLSHVRLKRQFKTELQLEVSVSEPKALGKAVKILEGHQNVVAFGLSQATLEDIFMRLSGVRPTEVIKVFHSGNLTNFNDKADENLRAKDNVELSQLPGLNMPPGVVKASNCQQFGALFSTNLRRQVRSPTICCRVFIPALLLALIGLVTWAQWRSYEMSKGLVQMDDSGRRAQISSYANALRPSKAMRIICLHDGIASDADNESCAKLSLSNEKSIELPILIRIPSDTNLKSFLVQSNTIRSLQAACGLTENPCIIYYASSWAMTHPNKNRTITIGVFTSGVLLLEPVFVDIFKRAYERVSLLYNAGELNSTTVLSHIKPLSQYYNLQLELILFLCVLGLFPGSYLGDIMEDANSRVRDQLSSMGMTKLAYWANNFIVHWIQYFVCFIISVALLAMWDRYRNAYFLLVACLPVLLIGIASNQLTVYAIAAITRTPSTVVSFSYNFLATTLPLILIAVSTRGKAVVLPLIWLLPPMAPVSLVYFSAVLSNHQLAYYQLEYIADIPNLYKNCWSNLYILLSVMAMAVHIAVTSVLIAVLDNPADVLAAACCCRLLAPGQPEEPDDGEGDQGAQDEAARLAKAVRNPENVLEVRQVRKTHPNGVRAVKGVTFGAISGEIFGLLGPNGAGKTTSLSVIVGSEVATSGSSEVRSHDDWLSGRRGASRGAIGHCPQHNPLFDRITVAEHLQLYARIRGVPASYAGQQTASLMQALGLKRYENNYAKQLSGGSKRRLCLAIALLGDPALIVIDEASTGVDPENKRLIWSAIRGMAHSQRSVVLTTHSMEEVEALCTRVGIMYRGRMIAFGTVQELRSRHGDAYTLEVMLQYDSEEALLKRKEAIKSAIASQFQGAVVLEDLTLYMQFNVPKKSVSRLSAALDWLAANRSSLDMLYYSFHQMSLDQVFVKLAKKYDTDLASD